MAYSILLVDDDVDTRSVLGTFLTDSGFEVHTARDGRHALQILERVVLPDLILLDYKMPMMNGSQFLAVKRRNPRLRPIPVIMLSSWTREWAGSRRLDVAEVLSKPVDLDRLLELVTRISSNGTVIPLPSRTQPESPEAASG